MIRIFSIFCKLNQISLSDRQWVEKESESLSLSNRTCPVCHSQDSLSYFASYRRCLIERKNCRQVVQEIGIKRFRCHSCGHTHALISSALVPYSSYSLRFILLTLRDYFLGRSCVQHICDCAGIAVSTLYRWKKMFIRHRALWMATLENMITFGPAEFAERMDGRFLQSFCQTFLISFLQSRRGKHPPSSSGETETLSAVT